MRTILICGLVLGTAAAAAETMEYSVTLTADLAYAKVEARFPGGVASVSARSRGANEFLSGASDCDSGQALSVEARSIRGDSEIRCLAYTVDLRKATAAQRRGGLSSPNVLLLPVDSWMWRPRLGGADEVVVTFDLPDGMGVSVPWQPVDAETSVYRLVSSPQSGTGLSVFGQFDRSVVQVAGADIRVAVVPSAGNRIGRETIEWTRQTAENVALAYGRFPNPDARVLLFPATSRFADSAVPFGRVVRDGGETVELLVDPSKSGDQFLGDWTATHEFAHLLLPYIRRDERWISEGFAQYYQNVLLARAGRYTQLDAWQKINDGLERGIASAPRLSPNEAAGGDERNARMKIYWSGAALFLMADVELRQQSNGSVSLDTVLDRFQACCLPSRRAWSGRELFEAFDSLIDEPLFADLHRQYADTVGFPPFRPLLDQLGVRRDGSDVSLNDSSELTEIRAAITARRYTVEPGK